MVTQKIESIKGVSVNFEGGEISGETGVILFHEFCEAIGVQKLLEKYLPEERIGRFLYQKPDILYQELLRIISGYTSNNTAFFLQNDPVFSLIHKETGVASSSTCCRLEQSLDIPDLKNFQKLQKELRRKTYTLEKPKEVILDMDTTYDVASEALHGANFNTHYQKTGFSPLVCFDGKTGDMIKGDLRPGNTHCSKKSEHFLLPLLKEYKRDGIEMFVRGDSAFGKPEIYEYCERYNALYFIRLKMNIKELKEAFEEKVRSLDDKALEMLQKTNGEIYFDTYAKAASWSKKRRCLARIQWFQNQLLPQYSAIITNDEEIDPKTGFEFYNQRATIENAIEEGKNGFSWDHLSHKSFNQNRAKFQVFLLASQIVNFFKRFCIPTQKEKSSIQTIRVLLLKVAAKVVKGGRKIFLKCASSFPFQELWKKTLENIQLLKHFLIPQSVETG